MTLYNYWWVIIWTVCVGGLCKILFEQETVLVLGKTEKRWSWSAVILTISPYILWCGNRLNNYGDTYAYRKSFKDAPLVLSELAQYYSGLEKDKGFYLFTALFKCLISHSEIAYFLVLACFQLLCVAYFFRKYSCDFWFSFFVFIASTDYLSWCHNGIRQFCAVCIGLIAVDQLLKKKYLVAIILILIAGAFHASALIMLPILYAINGKAWNKKTILLLITTISALFFVSRFTDLLQRVLVDTQYNNMVENWQSWDDDGTNPLRVLVLAMPALLSIIGYKFIKKENAPIINVATNASIATLGIALVSMVTSGILIGRLPIYVSLIAYGVLLPWEIEHFFTFQSARLVKMITIICYFSFFYYQMHFTWGLL